ncbi:MAG: hypothetical protein Q7T82_18080 [Armatimonadota bacterium]|nr:hypothetical protein [Armatimonadota bacterium]
MRFIVTRRFEDAYRSLPEALRRKTDKALRLLAENPKHPSLSLKRTLCFGTKSESRSISTVGIWEVRVDGGCRMTLEIRSDAFLLRNVGKHDSTLGNP